jgi:hypothetical protein
VESQVDPETEHVVVGAVLEPFHKAGLHQGSTYNWRNFPARDVAFARTEPHGDHLVRPTHAVRPSHYFSSLASLKYLTDPSCSGAVFPSLMRVSFFRPASDGCRLRNSSKSSNTALTN